MKPQPSKCTSLLLTRLGMIVRSQLEADTDIDQPEFRFWPKLSLATGEYSTAKLTFEAAP